MRPTKDRSPRECACGDHWFCSITQWGVALVDPEDAWLLQEFLWQLKRCTSGGRTFYVQSKEPGLLHQAITDHVHEMIDHRNRNGLDCRKANLRPCNGTQNAQNAIGKAGSSSNYKGVSWYGENETWIAYVTLNGTREHLGYFISEHDAALAYNDRAIELFGEFARLNQITEPAHRGTRLNGHFDSRALTDSAVAAIKYLIANGWRLSKIAERYRVCPSTITNIKSGKHYAHVLPATSAPPSKTTPTLKSTESPMLRRTW
jgi:hypothetical protein